MTPLELILMLIIWIAYGTFNAYQHNWYKDIEDPRDSAAFVIANICFAPIALGIRLFRGIFYYKLPYQTILIQLKH